MPKIDMTGQRFGRLTVITEAGHDQRRRTRWLCACSCGTETTVAGGDLRSGHTGSCGCLMREISAANGRASAIHGMYGTPTYLSWQSMRARCLNPKAISYPRYGGRGITVDPRWAGFEQFYADMGVRPDGTSLDRLDSNGPYSPSNCRWATAREQARNRRTNRLLTYRGVTLAACEWAERAGINRNTLYARLRKGWSVERALSTGADPAILARLAEAEQRAQQQRQDDEPEESP
jgi:hypothetical protein